MYSSSHLSADALAHVDGLEQERWNSIANALELCLSCPNTINISIKPTHFCRWSPATFDYLYFPFSWMSKHVPNWPLISLPDLTVHKGQTSNLYIFSDPQEAGHYHPMLEPSVITSTRNSQPTDTYLHTISTRAPTRRPGTVYITCSPSPSGPHMTLIYMTTFH